MALAGVKSCTFDLTDVGGKAIKVETTKLNQAHVFIEGRRGPAEHDKRLERGHGGADELVFSGTACNTWKHAEQHEDRSPVPLRHHHLRVNR